MELAMRRSTFAIIATTTALFLLFALLAIRYVELVEANTVTLDSLPIYPTAKNIQVRPPVWSENDLGSVWFETADSAQAVFDYYDRWLVGRGWRRISQGYDMAMFKCTPKIEPKAGRI